MYLYLLFHFLTAVFQVTQYVLRACLRLFNFFFLHYYLRPTEDRVLVQLLGYYFLWRLILFAHKIRLLNV